MLNLLNILVLEVSMQSKVVPRKKWIAGNRNDSNKLCLFIYLFIYLFNILDYIKHSAVS